MASVPAARLDTLLAEVQDVLAWAHAAFAAQMGAHEEGGLWQYDLQCERCGQPLLELRFDALHGRLQPVPAVGPDERVTLNLSLSGSPVFGEAFTARFGLP